FRLPGSPAFRRAFTGELLGGDGGAPSARRKARQSAPSFPRAPSSAPPRLAVLATASCSRLKASSWVSHSGFVNSSFLTSIARTPFRDVGKRRLPPDQIVRAVLLGRDGRERDSVWGRRFTLRGRLSALILDRKRQAE